MCPRSEKVLLDQHTGCSEALCASFFHSLVMLSGKAQRSTDLGELGELTPSEWRPCSTIFEKKMSGPEKSLQSLFLACILQASKNPQVDSLRARPRHSNEAVLRRITHLTPPVFVTGLEFRDVFPYMAARPRSQDIRPMASGWTQVTATRPAGRRAPHGRDPGRPSGPGNTALDRGFRHGRQPVERGRQLEGRQRPRQRLVLWSSISPQQASCRPATGSTPTTTSQA